MSGDFRTTDSAESDLERLAEYRDTVIELFPDLPSVVENYMSIAEADALALARFFDQYPHETKVLEIGTFVGVSAFHLAGRSKVSEVLTVDTNPSLAQLSAEWGEEWGDARVQEVAAKALARFPDRARKVRFFEGTAESVGLAVPPGAPLVAFVDGDHARASVEADLKAVFGQHQCTLAILHDCRRPSVLAAIMNFVATSPTQHCFRLFERDGPKAPNLGLIYTEASAAEVAQSAPGVLASPVDSLLQAAASLSEAWEREQAKASRQRRQRQRAEREQTKESRQGLRVARFFNDLLTRVMPAPVRRRDWKRAVRGMLVSLKSSYLRGLALVTERPRLAWEHQDHEQQPKKSNSDLTEESGEVRRSGKQRQRGLPVGGVHFGDLRRLSPISRRFGFDRGMAIDRYYIENFLARHADDVRGRVLEIADNSYTRRYGGSRVIVSDVLHVAEGNPRATIVADLTRADHIPSDAFDCIIFTQTLQFIYDARLAIQTLYRILKPGGILLATVPGIGRLLDPSQDKWGVHYHWAFTLPSIRRLFEESFPSANVEVEAHGNVLAAISFLHGLAAEDLRREELDRREAGYDGYEVLIALRAVKPGDTL